MQAKTTQAVALQLTGALPASVAAPASGATITVWDSGSSASLTPSCMRIDLSLVSSHDSGTLGVVFQVSFDGGVNWDTINSFTYSAAGGQWTYSCPRIGDRMRVRYTNSANTLTTWRGELRIVNDRSLAV